MIRKLFSVFAAFIFCGSFAFCGVIDDKKEDDILRDFLWREFINLPQGKRPKIGVTLSAGAVRGLSHICAISA